ncbi:hypothetical protein Hdeb2414_s0024g00646311 [Helianthus debilis subsp. tardiflorus]
MWSRVLSGVRFLEVLAYLLPLCNEDTGPVAPALIFQGVTPSPHIIVCKMLEIQRNPQQK